jgi:hypothetical protein
LNSGVNDRRRRGCFRSMVSMMNILPPGAEPLMVNVRQTGGSPGRQFHSTQSADMVGSNGR